MARRVSWRLPRAPAHVSVAAPLQVQASVWRPEAASAPPVIPASDSLWRNYSRSSAAAVVPAAGMAGYLTWLDRSFQPSNAEDSATEKTRGLRPWMPC